MCFENNVSTTGEFCLDLQHLKVNIASSTTVPELMTFGFYLPQTVNEIFLYSTVSTLKPIVGIVVTISPANEIKIVALVISLPHHSCPTPLLNRRRYSPNLSLYKIVVLPAASSPTILNYIH